MKKFTMVELFSGIGAQAKAFSRACKSRENISFSTVSTCEWDIHAIIAYYLIHKERKQLLKWDKKKCLDFLFPLSLSNDGKKKTSFSYISKLDLELLRTLCTAIKETNNMIDVTKVKGEDLPSNLDVLTYSFPCQDLSNVGAFHGYNKGIDRDAHSRSGLLWEVERILKERVESNFDLPRFLILENVTSLEAKRHLNNFQDWQNQLKKLGYMNIIFRLDAMNLGIPQHRKRLIMLSVLTKNNKKIERKIDLYFKSKKNNINNRRLQLASLRSFLRLDYKIKKYFNEALSAQPNNTQSRLKIWEQNLIILDENNDCVEYTATITTKQDRHPNSGNLYFDYEGNYKSKYRFLTPRECFLLMGFDEKDYEKIAKKTYLSNKRSYFFSRDKLYKLAGNSIVVNVLEQIFNAIIDLDDII